MSRNFAPRSFSRKSAGVLLLVGILAGVTVGGGVGVIAASSTKTVTVCANKKTNILRYGKNGNCAKTETKVVLNQAGTDGATGATGAKGDAGAAGSNGTAGAKGDTGATGTKGDTGDDGAPGSSFSARSVCGLDYATLCDVGVVGPGGGTVFYVDTAGKYSDFDYLEVAPTNASTGVAWSTTTQQCGLTGTSCTTTHVSTSGESLNFWAIGTGRAATAEIVARHDAGTPVAKTNYAAGVADAYTTQSASDWFLPSMDELNEVCKYARNTGQAAGASTVCSGGTLRSGFEAVGYWSSTQWAPTSAWNQYFDVGNQLNVNRTHQTYVRPVRAF